MELRTVYCSACDREVRVALQRDPDASAGTDPEAFVCLDCGVNCTGSLCPITAIPPAEMRAKLDGLRQIN